MKIATGGTTTPRCLALLGASGAFVGPLVDGIHNQALLEYDTLPISLGGFETSLLIPPLLSITYTLLGGVLPPITLRICGDARVRDVGGDDQARAAAAILSTCAIVRLSAESHTTLSVLAVAAFIQWLVLDASLASLLLGFVVALSGPIAEIPFIEAGCWHYLSPDYFPIPGAPGIATITGPCYFAVTTDAIALGRWFNSVDKISG